MNIYFQKFEIRWSDIDANRHVGNSAYMNFCSHTRMSFLKSAGFSIGQMIRWNIGPIILKEEFVFYKELYADQEIYVSLELTGTSEDASAFIFTHKIYDMQGIHHTTSIAKGVWIDMIQRKRTSPPEELKNAILATAGRNLKLITLDDIKENNKPEDINPSFFNKK